MTKTSGGEKTRPSLSFIVGLWAWVFHVLSRLSLLGVLRRLVPWLADSRRSSAVVESWVLLHVGLAAAGAVVANKWPNSLGAIFVVFYAAGRVFEIVVTQFNILFFDEWRASKAGTMYALRSYRRLVLLLLHNYVEIVFWFTASMFVLVGYGHLKGNMVHLGDALRAAMLSMVTFSIDGYQSITLTGSVFLVVQSMVGIFMTVLTLARFVSLIPSPASLDPSEKSNGDRVGDKSD